MGGKEWEGSGRSETARSAWKIVPGLESAAIKIGCGAPAADSSSPPLVGTSAGTSGSSFVTLPGDTEVADLGRDERRAFEAMVKELEPAMRAIALGLCRDPQLASDVLQDTFESALKNFARKPPGASPRSWLATILRNRFIDFWRRASLSRRVEGQLEQQAAGPRAEAAPGWAAITPEQLRGAVDSLDEEFRAVYLLHAEGRSYQQIAAELSLPRATVGTRLLRARRKLREILLPQLAAPEDE